MDKKILVFDSHPVQYRVPIWQKMEKLYPGSVHVVYASDCSVRGYQDVEFGQKVAWDEPLLDGYSYSILNCEKGEPLSGWGSLTGEGVKEEIKKHSPTAILLTGLNYKYDLVAYKEAFTSGTPVWLRCETQDTAHNRSKVKSIFRSALYRAAYLFINKFFYIGKLNQKHYLDHGISASKLKAAHYCTVDRFESLNAYEKQALRTNTREQAGISDSDLVIGFSGKFISKKNPKILYEMLQFLPEPLRKRLHLYFIGSGELQDELTQLAQSALTDFGVKSHFLGFINQTKLPAHYLAMDLLVLPSQRMGETWGLVSNEAMQAGCGVIVSDAVGSGADFKNLERFKVFEENNAKGLAKRVEELPIFQRDFDWAKDILENYSIKAVAESFANELYQNQKTALATEMY